MSKTNLPPELEKKISGLEQAVQQLEQAIANRLKEEVNEYVTLEKDYEHLKLQCANLNKAAEEAENQIDSALDKIQEALNAAA